MAWMCAQSSCDGNQSFDQAEDNVPIAWMCAKFDFQSSLRRVFADLKVFEQGLESLRPLQAFALREIHGSEVSGRRRVRKDLPKLSERAGDRRRLAENLFLCVRIGLDNVQRRAPRRRSRCQERPGSASCTQTKLSTRGRIIAGSRRAALCVSETLLPISSMPVPV